MYKIFEIFSFPHGYSKIEKILMVACIIHISLYFAISIHMIVLIYDLAFALFFTFLPCALTITVIITVSTKT